MTVPYVRNVGIVWEEKENPAFLACLKNVILKQIALMPMPNVLHPIIAGINPPPPYFFLLLIFLLSIESKLNCKFFS